MSGSRTRRVRRGGSLNRLERAGMYLASGALEGIIGADGDACERINERTKNGWQL